MTKKSRTDAPKALITTIKRKSVSVAPGGEIKAPRIGGKLSLRDKSSQQKATPLDGHGEAVTVLD